MKINKQKCKSFFWKVFVWGTVSLVISFIILALLTIGKWGVNKRHENALRSLDNYNELNYPATSEDFDSLAISNVFKESSLLTDTKFTDSISSLASKYNCTIYTKSYGEYVQCIATTEDYKSLIDDLLGLGVEIVIVNNGTTDYIGTSNDGYIGAVSQIEVYETYNNNSDDLLKALESVTQQQTSMCAFKFKEGYLFLTTNMLAEFKQLHNLDSLYYTLFELRVLKENSTITGEIVEKVYSQYETLKSKYLT